MPKINAFDNGVFFLGIISTKASIIMLVVAAAAAALVVARVKHISFH